MNKWNDVEILRMVKNRIANNLPLVGEFVRSASVLNCPVDTGNLRNSINSKVDEKELSVRIGTPVEYAANVELGTVKQSAQPYLRPAVLENRSQIQRLLAK